MPGIPYGTFETRVPQGASVYVFSDGVFEIVTKEQHRWAIGDFLPRLIDPPIANTREFDRWYDAVQPAARPGGLDDAFSIVAMTFNWAAAVSLQPGRSLRAALALPQARRINVIRPN
jgi:hypothetical protein